MQKASSTPAPTGKKQKGVNSRPFYNYVLMEYLFFCQGKRKRQDDVPSTLHFLAEMEEAAEHRQAETDAKQLKLMVDMQNQAQQQEQQHERQMMSMMMSMMQQIMAMFAGHYDPHRPPATLGSGLQGMPPPVTDHDIYPFYPPDAGPNPSP